MPTALTARAKQTTLFVLQVNVQGLQCHTSAKMECVLLILHDVTMMTLAVLSMYQPSAGMVPVFLIRAYVVLKSSVTLRANSALMDHAKLSMCHVLI